MNCKNCTYYVLGATFRRARKGDTDEDLERGWALERNDSAGVRSNGMCLHPSVHSDHTDGWLQRSNDVCEHNGVYATCDECRGELRVGPMFGCIHFKAAKQ